MKHVEVVAAVICHGEEILCMQRPVGKHEYISLKFEFPGGKIEAGEGEVAALERELMEEMEMKVQVEDKFLVVNHTYPDFTLTMNSYICKVDKKDFVMKEHVDFKWLRKEELNQLDWALADIPIMEKIMRDGLN